MLNQDEIYVQTLTIHQFVLNMLDNANDPLKLTGSVINEDDYLARIEQMQSRRAMNFSSSK